MARFVENRCTVGDDADAVMMMVSWGLAMRRDDDYLRAVLLELEAHDDAIYHLHPTINFADEERRRYYHLRLLVDAGYVEESGAKGGVFRITNAGHDFLALTRSSEAWGAVKDTAAALGGASIKMLGEIAYALARDKLRAMGLPI